MARVCKGASSCPVFPAGRRERQAGRLRSAPSRRLRAILPREVENLAYFVRPRLKTCTAPSVLRFDFHSLRAEFFVTGNLRNRHANVPLIADAALRAMLRANVAVYAGSTAGVFWKRFFALGSG